MLQEDFRPSIGDLVWQSCLPGGVCVFLGEVECNEDHVIWEVLHPTEGLLQDADYYFDIITSYTHD